MIEVEFTLDNVKKLYKPRQEYMNERAELYIEQIKKSIVDCAMTGELSVRIEKKGDVGFITTQIKEHFSKLGFTIRDQEGHFLIEGWDAPIEDDNSDGKDS